MTESEAIKNLKDILSECTESGEVVCYITDVDAPALEMAIKALEQSPEMDQFAKWVAAEIFDDMWEYNKDSFAEIACRKLAKLGIVRAKGDEWELVEPQESEEV